MTNVTTILGNESGIQYQGVNDASSSTGTYPVIGLIVGEFQGGRTDKPMTITQANIKTMLGYDPENPYYMAVQDVLDSGVPSVQVLRVINEQISPIEPSNPIDTSNLTCMTVNSNPSAYWSFTSMRDASTSEIISSLDNAMETMVVQVNGQNYKPTILAFSQPSPEMITVYRENTILHLQIRQDLLSVPDSIKVCTSEVLWLNS